ncbi:MAG: NAD(P)-dependent oxidoreductase [Candidatus Omnitrophica bacterium]|nr:NAD(P)-dependent oxidoreductase [Candidatus Omnitrophota bacterium]
MSSEIKKVGFIGMGIMGLPMARNLMKAGFEVTVHSRTMSKCDELVKEGAKKAETPSEAARGMDATVTIVTDTPDVEAVILGENGVIESAEEGSVVIDMSTISPSVTVEIAKALKEKRIGMVDAPVSGGDVGAINGTLTIMAGGEESDFNRALPLFEAMGKTITHVGPSGAGQSTKLCNQVLVGTHLVAVCEALLLAKKSGLDLEKTLRVLTGGAANSWALANLGPMIAKGDHSPGFMVKLLLKDLKLIMEAASEENLPLPGVAFSQQMFRAVEAEGGGDLGTQGVIRAFEKLANFKVAD